MCNIRYIILSFLSVKYTLFLVICFFFIRFIMEELIYFHCKEFYTSKNLICLFYPILSTLFLYREKVIIKVTYKYVFSEWTLIFIMRYIYWMYRSAKNEILFFRHIRYLIFDEQLDMYLFYVCLKLSTYKYIVINKTILVI